MPPLSNLLRYWPLVVAALLAWLLLWLRPPREVSATLVVLAYLGFCLLTWRRHRQPGTSEMQTPGALLIGYASQGGQAFELARRSAEQLMAGGVAAQALPLSRVDAARLSGRALFIVSTYGEGEAPDNGARFARQLLDSSLDLNGLEYAVLALGDSQYQHFCGFGALLDRQLQARGAVRLFDRLDVDRLDAGALRHWQQQLGQLSGQRDFIDWLPASYQPWQLLERRCLNPNSAAAPVFELCLQGPADAHWQAGDLVEIGPRHAPERVRRWLHGIGLPESTVLQDGRRLLDALTARQLPDDSEPLHGLDADTLLAQLPLLAHREYSIASLPADGSLQLLVRLMHHPDGRLGVGSGWLCQHAEVGQSLDLRIRRNPAFHGVPAQLPMILIGNGTGLAGLRAHLRERPAGTRNWLLFGERTREHDQFCAKELQGWLSSGHLQRLDLAFSQDQPEKLYVQHLLRDAADELHRWLDAGAALYVCGSLEGMGRDLHQLLVGLLGENQLQQLTDQGRYRRDLY